MIKKIMIQNFKSIGEETLVFSPNNTTNIIYGENGSGKTNFISVFKIVKDFIIHNKPLQITQNKFSKKDFTKIYFEIEVDKSRSFEYVIVFHSSEDNTKAILDQEMLIMNNTVIFNTHNYYEMKTEYNFNRDRENSVFSLFDFENNGSNQINELSIVYNWFKNNLLLFEEINEQELGKSLIYNQYLKNKVLLILTELNIPIKNIVIDIVMKKDEKTNKDYKTYKVSFVHSKNISMNYNEESDGIKKIVTLLACSISLKRYKNKKTFIIDNIDNNIHYEVSKYLFNFFSKECSDFQLFSTSHNLEILNEKELSKKTFWFMEKNKWEKTIFFGLEDVKGIKSNHNWKKLYKDFRFGAYPEICYNDKNN